MRYSKINIITSTPRPPESTILIIYTGGTLGMVHDQSGSLKPFDFSSILDHVPSLRQLELNLTVISFDNPIDSSNVNPSHWAELGRIIYQHYDEFDGFVVLHGTDTMAFSASALSFMLENLNKPVIFTGAQLPISSLRSDARENLITALEIASQKQDGQPVVPEVCIYFNNVLLRANRSKKVESIFFDAFESENYPAMAESGVMINYNQNAIRKVQTERPLRLHDTFESRVVIIKLFPGISKEVLEAMLRIDGLRGVVLETYGAGNAPTDEWFIALLQEAVTSEVFILNVSQCPGGKVIQGRYETSLGLKAIGVVGGADLTVEAAISKMMIVLSEESDYERIKERMIMPVCGEMTPN